MDSLKTLWIFHGFVGWIYPGFGVDLPGFGVDSLDFLCGGNGSGFSGHCFRLRQTPKNIPFQLYEPAAGQRRFQDFPENRAAVPSWHDFLVFFSRKPAEGPARDPATGYCLFKRVWYVNRRTRRYVNRTVRGTWYVVREPCLTVGKY